jgi:phosphoglucosamine mutase
VDAEIVTLFGTSGVRGIVGQDLTVDLCRGVARALGTLLPANARVCLATDTRRSAGLLKEAVFAGLHSCGIDTTDLGVLPTPMLALLTRELKFDTGIMLTASHNPPEYNGIKLFNGDSVGYSRDQEREIERLYAGKRFRQAGRQGVTHQGQGMRETYLRFLKKNLPPGGFNGRRVVVDPGNGAASGMVSGIFSELGIQVFPINDVPDGSFPGRNPEPKEDTLQGTIGFLREVGADLAVCFDGDADRVVFCDREGFLGFNECIAFVSRLAAEESGKKSVATTVETGRLLDLAVEDLGVKVARGRVGDVHVAYLARETDAAIGVEQVGVYVFPRLGCYPDSIFAALTVLGRVRDAGEIRAFLGGLPGLFFDKSKVACPNGLKGRVMDIVAGRVSVFGVGEVNALDGVRLEFGDSWMLIRASGTEPAIRVLAESPSAARTRALLDSGVGHVERFVAEVQG